MRHWILLSALAIAVSQGAAARQLRRHSGTTIDMDTKAPIAARMHAYASATGRRTVAGCIVYDNEIDAKESQAPAGRFELQIPADLTNYVVSYCQPGYFARAEEFNVNTPDLVPVAAAPIELRSLNSSPDAAARAVDDDLMRVESMLDYLQKSDAPNYPKIMDIVSTRLRGVNVAALRDQLDQVRRSR